MPRSLRTGHRWLLAIPVAMAPSSCGMSISGEILSVMPGPSWSFPVQIAFSPDQTLVAAAGEGAPAFVWNVADGAKRYQAGADASDVAFSPDGSLLAVMEFVIGDYGGGRHSLVTLHDPPTGTGAGVIGFESDEFSPVALAFDPSGERLAVVSQSDQGARIVDLSTREIVVSISSPSPVGHAWSPDGSMLALVGNGGNPRLYDATSGAQIMELPGQSSWWLAFSPDGRRLASASDGGGDTEIWDITPVGNREVATHHLPGFAPLMALYGANDDEILLATDAWLGAGADVGPGSGDIKVALIDAAGALIAERPIAFVPFPSAYSAPAGLLGITDAYCSADIIDTGTLDLAYELPPGMYAKAISADGTQVLLDNIGGECNSAYTQPIVIEYPSEHELAKLPAGSLYGAHFSPDGRLVVTNSESGNYLFDIETEQILARFDHFYFVFAFSPDGEKLAATSSGTLSLFDVPTLRDGGSEEQALIWSTTAHVANIPHVKYTPDGAAIVTAGVRDGRVRVWDAGSGERITELVTDRQKTPWIDIHSDGGHLIALGADDTVRVYTLDIDELIQIAKDRVTRSFTEDECRAYLHLETCPET